MQTHVLFKDGVFEKATSNGEEAKRHCQKKGCTAETTVLRKDYVKQLRWADLPSGRLVITAGETKFEPKSKAAEPAKANTDTK